MIKNTAGVIVEWDTGIATGFASKQEAERFIKYICRKTAPNLNYSINRINGSSQVKSTTEL